MSDIENFDTSKNTNKEDTDYDSDNEIATELKTSDVDDEVDDVDGDGDGDVSDVDDDINDDVDDIDDIDDDEDIEINEDDDETPSKKTKTKTTNIDANELIQKYMNQNEEFDDDDNVSIGSDESEEDNIKFDNEIRNNHILNFHNDLIQSNFDEIKALTKVVRNKNGIIVDPLHKTLPILTKFERARILGLRSKQLSNGADTFIKVPQNVIQNHIIAEMELEQNMLPFIVCRPLPNGKKEYWKVQDLEQIDY